MRQNLELDKTIVVAQSGCGNKNTSECYFKAVFNKDSFYAGEQAMCRIILDNSQCANDVFCFKFKLIKEVFATHNWNEEQRVRVASVVVERKEVGDCLAGQTTDRTFIMEIPRVNKLDEFAERVSMQDHATHVGLRDLSASVYGRFLSVRYMLSAYVKHARSEGGKGSVISIPVKIVRGGGAPINGGTIVSSNGSSPWPEGWNPAVRPPVTLVLPGQN